MNAPFVIEKILADAAVGISELKKNPAAVIRAAQEQQVAILNRNKPVAYVISPEVWEYLCDLHEDAMDAELVSERLADIKDAKPVTLDELLD
jgi:antitoxin StbD